MKQAIIDEWWRADCVAMLKPLLQDAPAIIFLQLWKRRNVITNGGNMTIHKVTSDMNYNLLMVARTRYPWLRDILGNWPEITQYFKDYAHILYCKMVK